MLLFITQLFVSAGLLLIVANVIKGIQIEGWGSALLGALVLGIANACVRPLIVVLTLPLTLLTLGLFLLVVNGVMLKLTAALTPGIKVDSWGAAIIGALLLTLLNLAVTFAFGLTPPLN